MGFKQKLVKRQLKNMGIDISNPKAVTFKTIKTLIVTSVPSLINHKDMIRFLEDQIILIKKEWGE